MTTPEIFPTLHAEHSDAVTQIAKYLNCDERAIDLALSRVEPGWDSPSHLGGIREVTHQLNEAARHAKNLLRSLGNLSEDQTHSLIFAGCVTIFQIEHLRAVLSGDASDLSNWLKNRNRQGGRNPAAHGVAEGMRKLFRRLRRPVTFGQTPGEGGPSTEYGRAVQFALGAFGINADWRRPAQEAHQRQQAIASRFARCQIRKAEKDIFENPRQSIVLDGISIQVEQSGIDRKYVISLEGRDDLAPLRIATSKFSSGREVQEFALEWATSNKRSKP